MDLSKYNEVACDLVREMLEQITAKMQDLKLKSLKLEDESTVIIYLYEQGGGYLRTEEFIVQGIYLSDEDGLVLRTVPYSPTTRFVNECETGPDCPEIDYGEDYDFVAVDSDDIQYLSLLNICTATAEAFRRLEYTQNNLQH